MKFKKTLLSLIGAGVLALGSTNAKATLVPFEQTIPNSYSHSGSILSPELAVDGDYSSFSDILGDASIIENYLVPEGITEAKLKTKFELGKYNSFDISYFDNLSSDWKNLYHKDSWDKFSGNLEFILPQESYQQDFLKIKTDFSITSFGEDAKQYENSIMWIPEPSTIGLLGLGSISLLRRRK